jgi:hypothetical protein
LIRDAFDRGGSAIDGGDFDANFRGYRHRSIGLCRDRTSLGADCLSKVRL